MDKKFKKIPGIPNPNPTPKSEPLNRSEKGRTTPLPSSSLKPKTNTKPKK